MLSGLAWDHGIAHHGVAVICGVNSGTFKQSEVSQLPLGVRKVGV